MVKKKSCQNVRNPRVLSPVEREMYGWVDAEVFTQSSVLASEHLPELRREIRLTQDLASERDFVLEAAGPSDRLPFRALEDKTHFLWVYVELFTRLGVRLPFSDFQREFLTRCQVAASQLHLNGWGFLRTFERVCLHFGFRPSWRIFLYTYQLHASPPGNGFLSFRAYQGRRLFDAFEESIQEFKWHYFKVLPLPGTHPFWVDDEGKSFPWVYWNSGARECRITALDPLETLAFDFLQSLPVGLGKKSNFRCRWILDHSDAEFAYGHGEAESLRPLETEDDGGGRDGSSLGPSSCSDTSDYFGCLCFWPGCSCSCPRCFHYSGSSSDCCEEKRVLWGSCQQGFLCRGDEGAKEDPSVDLKKKGRKRKAPEAFAEEVALGVDYAWKHKVSPINRAFPDDYNFGVALDAGLTNGPTREILGPLVPEQLLGTAQHLACQLTACLQVGIEKAFATKVQMEKELTSLKDQVDVLMVERDFALAAPFLNAKIKSLTQEIAVFEGEGFSALARMTEVEEKARVQATQLESCRSALEKERKEAEGLAKSLREKQSALDGAEAVTAHWRDEWKVLAEETGDMVQETFEILMNQAEAQAQSELVPEERLDPAARVPLGEGAREDVSEGPASVVVEESGECLVPNL
ncbi:hypothetical protein PIB30_066921 [Stylosanthes scabra]|uniref:Transposase (Putative), gypsy type n=1 Tax=Stylosanthes scabra TaxID=79078 RepID=A0ABU6SNU9_9FABA|nr:hypothetical protein [Stylosanthes scabra]